MPSTCPGSRPIPSLLPGRPALKGTLARKIETFADQVGATPAGTEWRQ
jgi:hypothetical protein